MRISTPTRGRPTEPSRVASLMLRVAGPVSSDMPHTSRMTMSMDAKKSSTSFPMGAAPTEKNSDCSKPMRVCSGVNTSRRASRYCASSDSGTFSWRMESVLYRVATPRAHASTFWRTEG